MEARINVITAIWGDKYSEDYVHALRAQVPGLIVLGRERPLLSPQRYRHWWCKLEAFRPENADLRPCLFIDLDTFILGDLAPLLAVDPGLWLIHNFAHPETSNSGLFIAPDSELSDKIWQASQATNTLVLGRGDGTFLAGFKHRRLTDEFADILSYKRDQLYDGPKNARIVCFHGKPKPHQCDKWAKEYFDARALIRN